MGNTSLGRSAGNHPLPVALAIGAVAEALFCWRLTTPGKLMFDEVHYVPAARILLSLAAPANREHPLLGKTLIAAGIRIFGDGPLGWRFLSTIAGTGIVFGVFAILWLAFGRMRTAAIGSMLVLINFTVFVQARIAMLDGFMAAFVVGALAAMLWAMRGTGGQVWRRWLLGSILLGLAVGTKWTALPYVVYAAAAFVIARRGAPGRWPGMDPVPALAILGTASGLVYLATFAPAFFYADEPLTLATLLPFQATMYARQTEILPAHPYQSVWWTWPLVIRPIWYLYEPVDGTVRGVLMLGNPAVMWGGLVAVPACLWGWLREGQAKLGAIAAVWVAGFGVWAIIPKSLGFFYYYYLPSIWLCLALAAALDHWRLRIGLWGDVFLLLSAALFVYFWPILSAAPLYGPQAFQHWMWFQSWA